MLSTEQSLWREAYQASLYPCLSGELEVDVVIVGAGITGLTAAYLLKQSGLTVAVLDKDSVGGGTTGRTTGKVTSQHSLIYNDLSKRLGKDKARLYGQINQAAIEQVAAIVKHEKLDCGWTRDDNYVYTTAKEQVKELQAEAAIAAELGLPASFETQPPLPFAAQGAVKFSNQAKIHSQQYVLGLAGVVEGAGSYVFEMSNVIGIRDGRTVRVRTKRGKVKASHAIVATNVPTMPLLARGSYCILEYPMESYIVAGRADKKITGMYISPDDTNYSILPFEHDGEQFLLVGGESHLSGLRGNKQARYDRLARYAEKHFGMKTVDFRWSDRDYLSYDGLPLVGKTYPWSKHIYVASAFRKWGLSNGTAAAKILHDRILGIENPAAKIFDPNRLSPIASIPRVAAQFITGQN